MTQTNRTFQRIDAIISQADATWRDLPDSYQVAGTAWTRADPYVVAHELRRVAGKKSRFLEWGCGLGTHCLIADALGMEAHGIEISPVMVEAARRLAHRLNSPTVYAEGSFIPSVESLPPEDDGEFVMTGGLDGYRSLCDQTLRADDSLAGVLRQQPELIAATYDVIYAYPAPHHVDWFAMLFCRLAREGAAFWCYTETAGILAATKTGPQSMTPLRPA